MIEGIDKGWIIHKLNNFISPIKSGITNTDQQVYSYLFSADNELSYTASIADATTVTFAELPSTTISIKVYLVSQDANDAYLAVKRNSGDTQTFIVGCSVGYAVTVRDLVEIPTDGNQLYIVNENSSCIGFIIYGYTEKI